MSDHQESSSQSYQFQEYAGVTYETGQEQNTPGTSAFQPPQAFPYPSPGHGYPMAVYPVLPVQAAHSQKKALLFPLSRHATASNQLITMVIYCLVMLVLFAGCVLYTVVSPTNPAPGAASAFEYPDGSVNGLLILVVILLVLLIVPAIILLSGALFGALRAFVIAGIIAGGTAALLLVYESAQHIPITFTSANSPASISLVLMPVTAALVGFLYDRRRYAAWWKSFLCLLAGSALFIGIILLLTAIFGNPSNASQVSLVGFYVAIGCAWLLFVPLITLPVAGIEGITHVLLVARQKKRERTP